MWHATELTRVHFKKYKKIKIKIQKNHKMTCNSHYSWSLML